MSEHSLGRGYETIRTLLDSKGFDWESGGVVIQYLSGGPHSCLKPDILKSELALEDNPVLDARFSVMLGDYGCPTFVAKDENAIYFPIEYDGSAHIRKCSLDFSRYLDGAEIIPFPRDEWSG